MLSENVVLQLQLGRDSSQPMALLEAAARETLVAPVEIGKSGRERLGCAGRMGSTVRAADFSREKGIFI
jgi:hypothetical protein